MRVMTWTAESLESFVTAGSDFLRDGEADWVGQLAAPYFEQLPIGWGKLGQAAVGTVGDGSDRIAQAVDQPQFRLVDGPLIPAADIFPVVCYASRDLPVPGFIEEAVDFQRGRIQVELLNVVRGVPGGGQQNVTN